MVKNSSTLKKKKEEEEEEANQMGSFGLFHFEIRLAHQQRKDNMGSMDKFTSFFLLLLLLSF